MDKLFFLLAVGLLTTYQVQQDVSGINNRNGTTESVTFSLVRDIQKSERHQAEALPKWLLKSGLIKGHILRNEFTVESRMKPTYLEADFNGDGHLDVALQIRELRSDKVGFAVIHAHTYEVFIIGAGKRIPNGHTEDLVYIDLWKVNTLRINEAGLEETTGTGVNGALILEHPSLEIEKREVGGGLIYWNGKEYAYFHQTC